MITIRHLLFRRQRTKDNVSETINTHGSPPLIFCVVCIIYYKQPNELYEQIWFCLGSTIQRDIAILKTDK